VARHGHAWSLAAAKESLQGHSLLHYTPLGKEVESIAQVGYLEWITGAAMLVMHDTCRSSRIRRVDIASTSTVTDGDLASWVCG
jgi:hypothetical protein